MLKQRQVSIVFLGISLVGDNPVNTSHSPNVASMLAHCLRRWPSIETTLCEYPVCAGNVRFSPANTGR